MIAHMFCLLIFIRVHVIAPMECSSTCVDRSLGHRYRTCSFCMIGNAYFLSPLCQHLLSVTSVSTHTFCHQNVNAFLLSVHSPGSVNSIIWCFIPIGFSIFTSFPILTLVALLPSIGKILTIPPPILVFPDPESNICEKRNSGLIFADYTYTRNNISFVSALYIWQL